MSSLEEITLTVDEFEALRLADLEALSHEQAAKKMKISRATFGRVIEKARRTVVDALVNGKAILIEGGNYRTVDKFKFCCKNCKQSWQFAVVNGENTNCPRCNRKGRPQ